MGISSLRPPIGGALVLLCAWLHGAAVAASDPTGETAQPLRGAEDFPLPPPALAATLSVPAAARDGAEEQRRVPAVILVHDALGADPRGERYLAQLLAAGIAVLELLSDDPGPEALDLAASALAADGRIDAARIGVLGFGAGGLAAAAAAAPFAARALLYPGCATLLARMAAAIGTGTGSPLEGIPVLLTHGAADPANPAAACAAAGEAMARRGAVLRRIEYAGAGYAWDRPVFGFEGRALLPWPGAGGSERVATAPWPALAALSATQVAGFFAYVVRPAGVR